MTFNVNSMYFSLQLSFLYVSALLSTLEGFYVDDALQGQGLYTYEDGGVLHGTYVDGELNGPAQEFNGEGTLVFKGQYKDNNRCGECWVYYPVSQLSAYAEKHLGMIFVNCACVVHVGLYCGASRMGAACLGM